MAKVITGFILLVIIALFGYRRTFTKLHLPLGARYIYLTGTEFILVGVALGGELMGVLDGAAMKALTPLYSLCLGFVGLIIPHSVRLMLGNNYKFLFPGSALFGAVVVMFSDTFARTAFSPTEIPVGIVMAVLGAPFFLYLLRK